MKKVWKWIIGIVVGLIILAVLVGVGFLIRSRFIGYRTVTLVSRGYSERGPGMMPYGGFGFHMRGPGMMGHGFMPFGGLFGGLLSLGFLALVVLGIIWLARSLRTSKSVEVPGATPAALPAAATNPCKKCGKPIQDDWKVCPYCGKKV
ncbi:MAG TPA: zinc ribbon domain-containing protein [Anaerolineales bacterium]